MRILIAEDDQVLADGLLLVFRRCTVPSASDLREGCVPTLDFQCPCQCRTAEPGMFADLSGRICNKGSSGAARKNVTQLRAQQPRDHIDHARYSGH